MRKKLGVVALGPMRSINRDETLGRRLRIDGPLRWSRPSHSNQIARTPSLPENVGTEAGGSGERLYLPAPLNRNPFRAGHDEQFPTRLEQGRVHSNPSLHHRKREQDCRDFARFGWRLYGCTNRRNTIDTQPEVPHLPR